MRRCTWMTGRTDGTGGQGNGVADTRCVLPLQDLTDTRLTFCNGVAGYGRVLRDSGHVSGGEDEGSDGSGGSGYVDGDRGRAGAGTLTVCVCARCGWLCQHFKMRRTARASPHTRSSNPAPVTRVPPTRPLLLTRSSPRTRPPRPCPPARPSSLSSTRFHQIEQPVRDT